MDYYLSYSSALDPYTPEALLEERDRLQAHPSRDFTRGSGDRGDQYLRLVLTLIVTAAVSFFAIALTFDSWPVWFATEGALALGSLGYWLRPIVANEVVRPKLARVRRELNKYELPLEGLDYEVRVELVHTAAALHGLPQELRQELRPLWEGALLTAEALRHDHEPEIFKELCERREAAQAVARKQDALTAELAQQEARTLAEGPKASLAALNRSDIELARIYVTALETGREQARALTELA